MTPSTPSRKKPGAKANVIERLLAVKRAPLVPRSVEEAALLSRLAEKRVAPLERDMKILQKSLDQVQDIRERLADVPALPQKGTLL